MRPLADQVSTRQKNGVAVATLLLVLQGCGGGSPTSEMQAATKMEPTLASLSAQSARVAASELQSGATYRITNVCSDKSLDVDGANLLDGGAVQIWDSANVDNQKWRLDRLDDGAWAVVAQHSGKALSVAGWATNSTTLIVQWARDGADNQRWIIEEAGPNIVTLKAKFSGKALDVQGAGMANGTPVWQYEANGTCAQQWTLTLVSANTSTPASPSVSFIDSTGAISLNGRPFFPFGFYGISRTRPLAERIDALNLLADNGFNTIVAEDIATPDFGQLLDVAAARGVYVMVAGSSLPDNRYVLETVDKYKNKSAVLGWVLYDDVDDGKATVEQLRERHRAVKSADPTRITSASLTGYYASRRDAKGGFLDAVDSPSIQIYPITPYPDYYFQYNINPLVESYFVALDYAKAAQARGKALVLHTQTFRWNTPSSRYPTVKELRNLLYGQIIAGAKGMTSYDFSYDLYDNQKALWSEIVELRQDILGTLQYPVLSGAFTRGSTGDAELNYAYWEYQGSLFFVIVNHAQNSSKVVDIVLPQRFATSMATAPFVRLPASLSVANGRLTGSIAATDVQVYKLPLSVQQ
jgi:hypothetical protein